MKAKTFRIICFVCVALIMAIIIAFNVVYAMFSTQIERYLFSTKELDEAMRAEGEALSTQIEEEGIVMVKNDDDSLPLDKEKVTKVNVFGWSSTQWIMGGSGSGRSVLDTDDLHPETDFLGALKAYGIDYNTEITDMYSNYLNNRPYWDGANSGGTLHSSDYEFNRLYEPSVDDANYYTGDLLSKAASYSDVAIVVIGRVSGESVDCPKVQYKGVIDSKNPTAVSDPTRTYLEISTEEEALLEYVGETYGNVIVIINSTNAMNLGFLDTIEGLDSCLIVGGTGTNAAKAIPEILFGDVSPSGKTVDTYVYDFTTNPSYVYSGSDGVTAYTNGDGCYPVGTENVNLSSSKNYDSVSYLDYVEGIYVGYKWYETADSEGFWESSDAYSYWGVNGYDQVVQYPFGYGLTYTDFSWSVEEVSPASGSTLKADDTITVKVLVTNNGDYAAQEIVQLYFTAPYTKGGIEKSSVTLCAFAKTPTAVEPHETQELTLSFDVSDMASYDSQGIKVDNGGYILEAGTYTVKLMTDAHHLAEVERGSSATITYNVSEDINYTYDPVSGNVVHNLFTASDNYDITDEISIDGSDSNANITWLSRKDFAATFAHRKADARGMTDSLKETNLFSSDDVNAWLTANAVSEMPVTGQDNGIRLYTNGKVNEVGLTYGNPDNYDNDEMWDNLLDQITVTEMRNLVQHGYCQEEKIDSIGKPATTSVDGPSQIGSFNRTDMGVGYPNSTVLAQSWNYELSKSYGLAVGKEAGDMGYDGWYAPGINLHRSAFGGRNYEYYSEDSYLSGMLCAAVVEGAANAGIYTYIKHLIGYDQESMRDGLYCWMTEQTLREIYLKPFKIALDKGGAMGFMTSYGRIGAIWSGGSQALLTDLLRNEWDFKGAVITDYSDHQNYMSGDHMLLSGGDLWMDYWDNKSSFSTLTTAYNSNATFVTQLRRATKHIIYATMNAAYRNSVYNADDDVVPISKAVVDKFNWLIPLIIAVDVVAVAGCAVWVVFAVRRKDKPVAENK